ncbi:hypothetical protein CCHL11_05330 [Colletotrichum chlorophyti]|uniref:Uncharacterized protein n=1 Tax=Colletotrichum chlorophyti TaxID=708187 RepID=A0A1Q8RNX3_9PEZI|nr:hypothetical protein CCHL11_05330 [Colletotrichum chlorophyti]
MSSVDGTTLAGTSPTSSIGGPFTWILTPLIIFLALGILATLIQFERRRRLRKAGLQRPWPRRDLEANRQRARGQRSSRNGRWAWTTRSDEGLDEFGEAPPAYEPKAKPGQALPLGRGFEMAQAEHTATGAISPPGPALGHSSSVPTYSMPPDYSTATGSTSSSTPPSAVASPAPAVTRN